jgi:hypothetical protein
LAKPVVLAVAEIVVIVALLIICRSRKNCAIKFAAEISQKFLVSGFRTVETGPWWTVAAGVQSRFRPTTEKQVRS